MLVTAIERSCQPFCLSVMASEFVRFQPGVGRSFDGSTATSSSATFGEPLSVSFVPHTLGGMPRTSSRRSTWRSSGSKVPWTQRKRGSITIHTA
jgi:hypothetical protein